jgi:hypothetical protein
MAFPPVLVHCETRRVLRGNDCGRKTLR